MVATIRKKNSLNFTRCLPGLFLCLFPSHCRSCTFCKCDHFFVFFTPRWTRGTSQTRCFCSSDSGSAASSNPASSVSLISSRHPSLLSVSSILLLLLCHPQETLTSPSSHSVMPSGLRASIILFACVCVWGRGREAGGAEAHLASVRQTHPHNHCDDPAAALHFDVIAATSACHHAHLYTLLSFPPPAALRAGVWVMHHQLLAAPKGTFRPSAVVFTLLVYGVPPRRSLQFRLIWACFFLRGATAYFLAAAAASVKYMISSPKQKVKVLNW